MKVGVLLVSHGSPLQSWNDDQSQVLGVCQQRLDELAAELTATRGADVAFVADFAYMEFVHPDVVMALRKMEEEHADMTRVVVVPLFISVSSHTERDLANQVGIRLHFRSAHERRYLGRLQPTMAPPLCHSAALPRLISASYRALRGGNEPLSLNLKGTHALLVHHGDGCEHFFNHLLHRAAEALGREACREAGSHCAACRVTNEDDEAAPRAGGCAAAAAAVSKVSFTTVQTGRRLDSQLAFRRAVADLHARGARRIAVLTVFNGLGGDQLARRCVEGLWRQGHGGEFVEATASSSSPASFACTFRAEGSDLPGETTELFCDEKWRWDSELLPWFSSIAQEFIGLYGGAELPPLPEKIFPEPGAAGPKGQGQGKGNAEKGKATTCAADRFALGASRQLRMGAGGLSSAANGERPETLGDGLAKNPRGSTLPAVAEPPMNPPFPFTRRSGAGFCPVVHVRDEMA